MMELMILADETANAATVVNEFEELLLRIFVVTIMFGLGAGLTPKDFGLALRRPWGLVIGWLTQFGIMPLVTYLLIISVLLPFSSTEGMILVALGALIMGSVPAGTTSNLFTYFSKGNLALSVTMTVNSTLWAFIMTPAALFLYSNFLGLDESLSIEFSELALVIFGLIVPVGLGMLIRRLSANIGAVLELIGGAFGLLFIPFLIISWV
ncbi:MAG: bile acid:sodium symporter, partial [Aquiluna sp.]